MVSTVPWHNPSAWSDKLFWVRRYLGQSAQERPILSQHKHLNDAHYLVDDWRNNGADRFKDVHIHSGTADFPDWPSVVHFLKNKIDQ